MFTTLIATALVPTLGFSPLMQQDQEKKAVIGETSTLGDKKPLDGEEVAVIDTSAGRIILRFYSDKAPGHVANFKKLANDKFYDGTIFHRVIPGFMIQGGDPNTKDKDNTRAYGTGGPGYQIKAEFNDVKHERGILSMARSSDPDSAGSQFFVMAKAYPSLDGKYSVFGRVVHDGTEKEGDEPNGLAVVDKIVNSPRNDMDRPNERIEMKISIQKWPVK
jgi:peptidyl-prolyl cis-trans isomerase B (cyclophilin B)